MVPVRRVLPALPSPRRPPPADPADDRDDRRTERSLVVRSAGHLDRQRNPREAVAVETEERAKRAVLEPSDHELAVFGIGGITAVEAADVGRPPGDPGQSGVEARPNLPAQRVERGRDIARPDGGPVALASGPRRPAQQDDFLRPGVEHPFVEALRVQQREQIDDLVATAEMEAQVGRVDWSELRLAAIEPPDPDLSLI